MNTSVTGERSRAFCLKGFGRGVFLSFFLRKDFLFKNGYALAVKKGFGIVFFSPHQDFLLRCSRALTFGSVVFSLSFFLHKTILLLKNSHVVSTQKASPVASLSLHKHSLIQKKGDVRTCSKVFGSVFLPSFLPFFGPSFFLFLFLLLLFVCCCFSLTGDRAYQSHSSAIDELISAAQPMRSSQCSEEALTSIERQTFLTDAHEECPWAIVMVLRITKTRYITPGHKLTKE